MLLDFLQDLLKPTALSPVQRCIAFVPPLRSANVRVVLQLVHHQELEEHFPPDATCEPVKLRQKAAMLLAAGSGHTLFNLYQERAPGIPLAHGVLMVAIGGTGSTPLRSANLRNSTT
jgi:hypothetical protein